MFAIEVEYLLGRAVATDATRPDRVEWPPHPTRLFSALVDALADVSDDAMHEQAEAALRWIECEPPPEISVSIEDNVSLRKVAKHFVPINDDTVDPKQMRPTLLVELRTKQERFFPAAVPQDPKVVFTWPNSEPSAECTAALSDLASRVPYLGHSSSVVRVWCPTTQERGPGELTSVLVPAFAGNHELRVPGKGRFERLLEVYEARKVDTLVQPPKGKAIFYAKRDAAALPHGPLGAMRIVSVEGSRFGLSEAAWVIERFRQAYLTKFPALAPIPEELSGHASNGRPSVNPHIAFVPLANVSHDHHKYADGAIKGIGVLVPRDLGQPSTMLLDTALAGIETLIFGRRGELRVSLRADDEPSARARKGALYSLDERRYSRGATTWVSATPIVLGRFPKAGKGLTEEEIVVQHVLELGLPRPKEIVLDNVSDLYGAPPTRAFQRSRLHALQNRICRHAVITFAQPVAGPLVVGAGRYVGFGLLVAREDKPEGDKS